MSDKVVNRQTSIAEFHSEGAGANPRPPHQRLNIKLVQVESDEQKRLSDRIITSYHSYTPNTRRVGRYIDWLIFDDKECVGTIGLMDTPAIMLHARDRFIGWTNEQHNANMNKIVSNYRFTLMPNAPKNAGSKTLSILARICRRAWRRKYGKDIVLLETVVKSNAHGKHHNGTIYLASGWRLVGLTSGSHGTVHGLTFNKEKKPKNIKKQFSDRGGQTLFYNKNLFSGSRLLVFVKPLVRNFERRLKTT